MKDVVEVSNVCFSYGREPVFHKISFTVRERDFVAVVGSNGTGKSTLMKLLTGEAAPDGGVIRWFGQDIKRFADRHKIGYVPQHNPLTGSGFPATALEVVRAGLYRDIGPLCPARKEHTKGAVEALNAAGAGDCAKKLVGGLSGGQQQKVMLARALVSRPEALLLDEPAAGMDAGSREELFRLLGRINREDGVTIIIVTHNTTPMAADMTRLLRVAECGVDELAPHGNG